MKEDAEEFWAGRGSSDRSFMYLFLQWWLHNRHLSRVIVLYRKKKKKSVHTGKPRRSLL